jgi:hypothetical protein
VKADPQTPVHTVLTPPNPREHLEDARQGLSGDSGPGVRDIDFRRGAIRFDPHRDRVAGGTILCRVIEKIGEDLSEASRIALQVNRFGGNFENERIPITRDLRLTSLEGHANYVSESDSFLILALSDRS